MAPRLIRRRPLLHRIKAYLDPMDFLLWLSEMLDSSDWDQWQKEWAMPIGIVLNVVFLTARANSRHSTLKMTDDVFGDDLVYSSWASWFVRAYPPTYSLLLQVKPNVSLIGLVQRSSSLPPVFRERRLHFLPSAPLQTLRELGRYCSNYAISSPRQGRLFARCLVSAALSIKYAGGR